MSIYEPLSGNPYTTDPDYAAFTGRVVRTHIQKLGITLDGYVIGRVTRVIDIGRCDAVSPRDIEAQMYDEPLPHTPGVNGNPGVQPRTILFMQHICRLLGSGPMSMVEIAEVTGAGEPRIGKLLDKYATEFGIICKRGKADGRKWYWQLAEES